MHKQPDEAIGVFTDLCEVVARPQCSELGQNTRLVLDRRPATPLDELRELDGLILSGGAARVGLTGELGNCAAYLGLDIPILGICAGHQFMAGFYGGQAREAPKPEFGAATIELLGGGGPLFTETPTSQTVWESHNDEVIEAPPGFRVTASSESCGVQAMENESQDRFGLQFHPEVNDSEYGAKIFENFVDICRRAR